MNRYLTDEEYKRQDGQVCPNCRADVESIDRGDEQFAGDKMTQKVSCESCGATWIEQWEMIGYVDLTIPSPITIEEHACQRVANSDELRPYTNHIFYDWPNWDEHMAWVANAPIAEILDWCKCTAEVC
jgi:hypothetical protein